MTTIAVVPTLAATKGTWSVDRAFFIQFAASAGAISVLVALAAWAKIARPTAPLDEAKARVLLAEEFPGRAIDALWVASDGAGALARSGALALVVIPMGDGFVARQIPWAQALAGSYQSGRLIIDLADIAAPRAIIALPAWPPKALAA